MHLHLSRSSVCQLYAEEDSARTPEQEIKKLVNRFVGYGISKAMKKAVTHSINIKRSASKHEEDDNYNDSSTDSEVAAASGLAEQQLHADAMYEFISHMRIFHEEAMGMPEYLKECYEGSFMIQNMGFLTLVSPRYFDFATKLLTVVSSAFTQKSFAERGDQVLSSGRAEVDLNLRAVRASFLKCAKDDNANENDHVDEKDKLKVFNFIVEKTVNCWFASQLKQYRANNTGRQGKAHVKGDFRKDLASKCKGSEVADTNSLEAAYKAREET